LWHPTNTNKMNDSLATTHEEESIWRCGICLELRPLDYDILPFPCGHRFCRECSKPLLCITDRCPTCKTCTGTELHLLTTETAPEKHVKSTTTSTKTTSEWRDDIQPGFCVACPKELPPLGGHKLDLCRLLGIGGDLPTSRDTFRVCDIKCQTKFQGAEKPSRKPQLLVLKRLLHSQHLTDILRTPWRIGDSVFVKEDPRTGLGKAVCAGLGVVKEMSFDVTQHCAIMVVNTVDGIVRGIGPDGVLEKPTLTSCTRQSTTTPFLPRTPAAGDGSQRRRAVNAEHARDKLENTREELVAALVDSKAALIASEEKCRQVERRLNRVDAGKLYALETTNAKLKAANFELALNVRNLTEKNEQLAARIVSLEKQHQSIFVPARPSGKGAGRGRPHSDKLRLLVWHYLTLNIPPASIPETIATTAKCFMPELLDGLCLPDIPFCRKLRTELTALHLMRTGVALDESLRIRWSASDASPLHQHEIAITLGELEAADGNVELWHFAGSYEIADQSGEGEAKAISRQVLDRCSAFAELLRTAVAKHHGQAAASCLVPTSAVPSLVKLAGGVMSTDNASSALKMTRELAKLVKAAAMEYYGEVAWEAMSEVQQCAKSKLWGANCMRHLCNTFLDGGVAREKTWLEGVIGADVLNSFKGLRLGSDISKLLHALAKDIGTGSELYGLGEGVTFNAFALKELQGKLLLSMERVDKGMRQDGVTRAGLRAYWNLQYYVQFLYPYIESGGANLLQKYLYVMLTSPPVIACLRTRGIIHDKVTTPLLFFSASETLDWDVLSFAPVIQALSDACLVSSERFLEEAYDPFDQFLRSVPAYVTFRREVEAKTALVVTDEDGLASRLDRQVKSVLLIRSELYRPKIPTNQGTHDHTLQAIAVWQAGMLHTLNHGEGARYVGDGDRATKNQTPEMKDVYKGTKRHTNNAEGWFGALKQYDATFTNVAHHNASGVVGAHRDHLFESSARSYVDSYARSEKAPSAGVLKKRARDAPQQSRLWEDPAILTAAIQIARTSGAATVRDNAHTDRKAADEKRVLRREEKQTESIERQVSAFARAKSAMLPAPIVTNEDIRSRKTLSTLGALVTAHLAGMSPAMQAANLKAQIERFVYGMGFASLKPTSFSSTVNPLIGKIGSPENITFLENTLNAIFAAIRHDKLVLVDAAVVPGPRQGTLPSLGGLSVQRLQLESETPSPADLQAWYEARPPRLKRSRKTDVD